MAKAIETAEGIGLLGDWVDDGPERAIMTTRKRKSSDRFDILHFDYVALLSCVAHTSALDRHMGPVE